MKTEFYVFQIDRFSGKIAIEKTLKLIKDKAFFQAGTKDKRGVTAQFITTYIDADRVLKVTPKIFDLAFSFPSNRWYR